MMPGQAPMQQQQQMSFPYQQLQRSLFSGDSEKSLVDKLLGRQDADKLHSLMKKDPLDKSDIEEILFLMTSIDQKIVNYDDWDRYVIIKLFPWVKDYSTVIKTWMIYEEQFKKGNFDNDFTVTAADPDKPADLDPHADIAAAIDVLDLKKQKKDPAVKKDPDKPILAETKQIVTETTKYMQHNLKFLVSVFLLVSNSTLSIDGAAFETLTTSRFEYHYPNLSLPQPQQKSTIGNMLSPKRK